MEMFVYLVGIIACVAISGSSGRHCTTPAGTHGSCISIKQCDPLLRLLRSSVTLQARNAAILRKSQCGYDGVAPRVCCPNKSQRITPPKVTKTPRGPPDVSNHTNLRLLKKDVCGKKPQSRIYGGNKTSVVEFPWMALLGYEVGGLKEIDFKCGGSVITKRYILTAAHCVTKLDPQIHLSMVRVGEHDLDKEIDCDYDTRGVPTTCADKYQDLLIEHVHFHDQYKTAKEGNDIALIRLDRNIDFRRNNVKPICLPIGKAATFKIIKGTVTGWGLRENLMRSNTLLKVNLPIVPKDECAKAYKVHFHQIKILDNQLCAGSMRGVDSCRGDSGGPLQSPSGSNGWPQYFQYGVVSFGHPFCGTKGVPGVYTKVAYYMDWILDTISD